MKKRFQLQIKKARLEFDESSGYDGLVVDVRTSLPLEVVLEAQSWGSENVREFVDKFGDLILLDWNLNDTDGTELPATKEGLMKADTDLLAVITNAWIGEIGATPPPLEETSPNGVSLEELPDKTEVLSENPSA
jgi:hypothetical protein